MNDRSDDPSHHELTLLPRNYISLLSKVEMQPTLDIAFYKILTAIGDVRGFVVIGSSACGQSIPVF